MNQADHPLVSAQAYIEYLQRQGKIDGKQFPKSVLLCFQRFLVAEILSQPHVGEEIPAPRGTFLKMDSSFGIVYDFGIGASVAAMAMEELIACGVENFYLLGIAGSIRQEVKIGDCVAVTGVVREDGVSDYYLPHTEVFMEMRIPTVIDQASRRLQKQGYRLHRGPTWTTCAPYREFLSKRNHYHTTFGVSTVEMEIAALASVAQEKSREFGALLVVSDSLSGDMWKPKQRDATVAFSFLAVYSALRESILDRDMI